MTMTAEIPKPRAGGWLAEIAGRTPASYFGIVLGLGGLGNAWRAATKVWALPPVIGEAIFALAGLVWALLVLLYILKAVIAFERLNEEARHPIQCCFIGLAGVATMLIAGGLLPYWRGGATLLFGIGFLFTAGFAIWRTGGLWHGERDHAHTTAVLYLPTVAGSFVTATVVSALGQPDWGQLAFGAGMFSWLAMESVILHRLLTGPAMPKPIRPTLGIMLAPAPVGAVAYTTITGAAPDLFVHGLIGYGLLQLAILIRLLPWLRESGPAVGFWGLTFGATSIAIAPLRLVAAGDGGAILTVAVTTFVLANLLVGVLTLMTLWLLLSGRMYGAQPPTAPAPAKPAT